jgi:hypothetical protein
LGGGFRVRVRVLMLGEIVPHVPKIIDDRPIKWAPSKII